MNEIKVRLEVTEGYEKRYTQAVLKAYQRTADRKTRTLGRAFHSNSSHSNDPVPNLTVVNG